VNIENDILLLAGGIATRLRPVTENIPKSLIDVAGKPFILHQLELLKRNGFVNIILCLGYLGEKIEKFIKDGSEFDVKVRYSYDGENLLGTGGAIKKAMRLSSEVFFVMYGDSYLDIEYSEVFKFYNKTCKSGLMTVYKNNGLWDNSNVIFRNGKIIEYDKKKRSNEMNYIDYGLGIFKKQDLMNYPANEKFDMEEYYKYLLDKNELAGYEVYNRFYEIGSFEGIKETENYIINKKVK